MFKKKGQVRLSFESHWMRAGHENLRLPAYFWEYVIHPLPPKEKKEKRKERDRERDRTVFVEKLSQYDYYVLHNHVYTNFYYYSRRKYYSLFLHIRRKKASVIWPWWSPTQTLVFFVFLYLLPHFNLQGPRCYKSFFFFFFQSNYINLGLLANPQITYKNVR